MNYQTTHAFMEKIIQAKQLEKEALLMLLPDHVKGHLNVIEKEVKALMIELLIDTATHKKESSSANEDSRRSHVNKVNID